MKNKNLFIGILVIFVGVVSLLYSLEIIDFHWRVAMKLWPLILTIIGISILPLNDYLKALFLLIALGIGCLLYQYEDESKSEEQVSVLKIYDDNKESIQQGWEWLLRHSDDI